MLVGILVIACVFTLILLITYIIFCNFEKLYFFCINNKKKVLFFLVLISIVISVYFNKSDDYNDDFDDSFSIQNSFIQKYNNNLDDHKE